MLTTLRDPALRPAHSEVLSERDCEDGGGEEAHLDSQEVSLIEPPSAGQSTHSERNQSSTGEPLPPPNQQPRLHNQNGGAKEEESKKSEDAVRVKEKEDRSSVEQLDGRENSTDNPHTGPTAGEGVRLTEHSEKEEGLDGHLKKEDPLIPDRNETEKLPLDNTEKAEQPDHPREDPMSHQTMEDEVHSHSPPPKQDKQLPDHHEGNEPPVELTTAEEQVEHTHSEEQQLVSDDGTGGGGVEGEPPLVRDEQENKTDAQSDLSGDPPSPPSPLPEEGTPRDLPNEKEPLATPPCDQVVQTEKKSDPPSLSAQHEDEAAQPVVNKNGKTTPHNPFLEDGGELQLNPFQGEDGGKTGLNPFLDYGGGSEEALTRQLEPDEPTPSAIGGQSMPDTDSVLNQLEELQSVQVPPLEIPGEQLEAFLNPTSPDLEIRLDEEGLAPLIRSESDSSLEEHETLEEPENDTLKELERTKQPSSDYQDNDGGSPPTHQEQM